MTPVEPDHLWLAVWIVSAILLVAGLLSGAFGEDDSSTDGTSDDQLGPVIPRPRDDGEVRDGE